jgi:excisionase family DNA binding protein
MRIVTVKEVAAFLKVKEKTLYQWAEMRQMPSLKINGSLRFDLDDIEAWIAGCKQQPKNSYNPLTKLEAQRKGGRNN